MSGHPQATGLYGAPKLLWKLDVRNPDPRVMWRRDTRCGRYRISHQQGVREPVFIAVYLPTPTQWDCIAVERSEEKALAWVQADHERRSAEMVQLQGKAA